MKSLLGYRTAALPLGLLAAALMAGAATSVQARTLVVYQCLNEEEIIPLRDGFVKYWQETHNEEIEWEDFFQPCGEIRATVELEARGNAVQPDVLIADIGDFASLEMKYPELFKAWTPPAIAEPEFSAAVRESAERTKTNFVIGLAPYVIVYNTDRVKPEEVPDSWADLTDPRWKGRLGMGDPETTAGAHVPLWYVTKYLADKVGAPYGREYYAGLGENEPVTAGSHGAIQEYVNAGELDVGILSFAGARTSANSGNHVAAVLPKEGRRRARAEHGRGRRDGRARISRKGSSTGCSRSRARRRSMPGPATCRCGPTWSSCPAPFPFDAHSPMILPVDAKWVAENRADNIAYFREVIK